MSELPRLFTEWLLGWIQSLTAGQLFAMLTVGMMAVGVLAALLADAAYQQSRRP